MIADLGAQQTCIVFLGLIMVATGRSVMPRSHVLVATHALSTTSVRGTDIARLMLIVLKSWHAKTSMEDWEWFAGIAKYRLHAPGPLTAQSSVALACPSLAMIRAITATTLMNNLLTQL